jgi:hypothetical protein
LTDAQSEVGAGSVVDGDGNYARESAAEKGRDPLGRVLTPEEGCIALSDVARGKFACKLVSGSSDAGVRPVLVPVSTRIDVCRTAAPAFEVFEVIE